LYSISSCAVNVLLLFRARLRLDLNIMRKNVAANFVGIGNNTAFPS